MGKFWSVLFLLVPVLGVATFVVAPWYDHWLPVDVSQHGRTIDHLFYFILYLTGVVFILTEVALFYFMWRYNAADNAEPVKFMHGSHGLEVVWTIVPAATLLFIAIYQMNAWAENKIFPPKMPPTVEVMGRQFEWRIRYPGLKAQGTIGDQDDILVVNDLHIPVNENILIDLKSADVLHSFFLPNLRVKQDAVPGMKVPVWFRATQTGVYDIVCAELCGWGHYKMKGRLTIEPRAEFETWLQQRYEEQRAASEPAAVASNEESQ